VKEAMKKLKSGLMGMAVLVLLSIVVALIWPRSSKPLVNSV
jgi:hypothetical protein